MKRLESKWPKSWPYLGTIGLRDTLCSSSIVALFSRLIQTRRALMLAERRHRIIWSCFWVLAQSLLIKPTQDTMWTIHLPQLKLTKSLNYVLIPRSLHHPWVARIHPQSRKRRRVLQARTQLHIYVRRSVITFRGGTSFWWDSGRFFYLLSMVFLLLTCGHLWLGSLFVDYRRV